LLRLSLIFCFYDDDDDVSFLLWRRWRLLMGTDGSSRVVRTRGRPRRAREKEGRKRGETRQEGAMCTFSRRRKEGRKKGRKKGRKEERERVGVTSSSSLRSLWFS